METKKVHVFFRRVSTIGQDIATQEATDLPYGKKSFQKKL
jgi:hypothetical protein